MQATAITLLLLTAAGHQAARVFFENDVCTDGVSQNFTCVQATNCNDFNLSDLQAARNRICGYDGNKSKVCCKPEDVINPSYSPKPMQSNQLSISAKCNTLFPDTTSESMTDRQMVKMNYVIDSNWLDCNTSVPEDRILGGEVLGITEHPWLAIVYQSIRGKEKMLCGGSLIFRNYVITAAHCVTPDRTISKVRLGEWDVDSEEDCRRGVCSAKPVDVAVDSVIVHPSYNNSSVDQAHDIAILKLATAVNYTEWVKPVCLPRPTWTSAESYIASGWGQTEFAQHSQVKRQVKLKHVESDICRASYPKVNLSNVICAGGRLGEDTCRGDSGSSLVSEMNEGRLVLMGLTSVGSARCGTAGVPSIYTRVSSYISWIAEKIEIPMCATS